MKERRLTLDTNILFYAMDQDAGSRHNLAMEMLIALQSLIVLNPAIVDVKLKLDFWQIHSKTAKQQILLDCMVG